MRLGRKQQQRTVEVARERGYRCKDCGSQELMVEDEGKVQQTFGGERGATADVRLGCAASYDCTTIQTLELTLQEARELIGFDPPMKRRADTL